MATMIELLYGRTAEAIARSRRITLQRVYYLHRSGRLEALLKTSGRAVFRHRKKSTSKFRRLYGHSQAELMQILGLSDTVLRQLHSKGKLARIVKRKKLN